MGLQELASVSAQRLVNIGYRAIRFVDQQGPLPSAHPVVAGFARGRSTRRDRPLSSGVQVSEIAALTRRSSPIFPSSGRDNSVEISALSARLPNSRRVSLN